MSFSKYFALSLRRECVVLADDAPEHLREFVYRVHSSFDLPPNDWLYEKISDAFRYIEEIDGVHEEAVYLFADDCVDVYSNRIMDWLGVPAFRSLAEQTFTEYGNTFTSIADVGQFGQYEAGKQIFEAVAHFLETYAETEAAE